MAAMACTTLAQEHESPGASAVDAAKAAKLRERSVRLLQEACDGNGWECRGLAAMYEQGEGVPGDPEKAATLWKRYAAEVRRACEHDTHPGLLGELAQLYADGKGVPQDAARAGAPREGGCDHARALRGRPRPRLVLLAGADVREGGRGGSERAPGDRLLRPRRPGEARGRVRGGEAPQGWITALIHPSARQPIVA